MLFDAYLAVDWSARGRPSPARPTADSVWIGELAESFAQQWNPRTRAAARSLLSARLTEHVSAGRRVLVGFDFALGYPAGFARALGLSGPPWRAMWDELSRLVVDDAANASNRFEVATTLNERCGDGPGPLWGCPPSRRTPFLASVSPGFPYGSCDPCGSLARLRATDRRGAQPVWKLYGNGSVGSQTLVGIPVAAHLRSAFAGSCVWPFESGFAVPSSSIVYAEIWPSLAPVMSTAAVKDQRQVRDTVTWLSSLDRSGSLAPLFGPPPDLAPDLVPSVVAEEGWILGI